MNFKQTKVLKGHTNFDSFLKEYEDIILSASQYQVEVEGMLLEPVDVNTDMSMFNVHSTISLYQFDNWFIALKEEKVEFSLELAVRLMNEELSKTIEREKLKEL